MSASLKDKLMLTFMLVWFWFVGILGVVAVVNEFSREAARIVVYVYASVSLTAILGYALWVIWREP